MFFVLIIAFIVLCFVAVSIISISGISVDPDIFFASGLVCLLLSCACLTILQIRKILKYGYKVEALSRKFDSFDKKILKIAGFLFTATIAFVAMGFKLDWP